MYTKKIKSDKCSVRFAIHFIYIISSKAEID